jgi:ABC-type iron transport system FetAB ATPase subunit
VSLAGATHPATKGKTSMIRSLASSMSMTRGRSTTKGTVVTKVTPDI